MEYAESSSRHLLVTGACGGIGAEVCRQARHAGWTVTGWDIAPGADARVNVASPSQVDAALDAAEKRHGPIHALVHAAGTFLVDDPVAVNIATLEELLYTNVVGTAAVCAAVGRRMRHHRASNPAIVAVTSNAAHTPRIRMASYAASKAAAASYVRSLALALARDGIRCNAVSPGSTLTPMLGAEPDTDTLIRGVADDFRLGIPLGRIAEPADVAAACLWLLSPAARHITGHDLRIDGGATLDAR